MTKPYAVIQLAGKQYVVSEGETLTVNKLEAEKTLTVNDVLLVVSDKKVAVGQPLVKDASVKLEVIEQHKGDKLRVFKFKSKSRYRRTQGHRQHLTTLKVTKIVA